MARKIFKDNQGRNLREGERQKKDGRYEYRYLDMYKQPRSVYSWRLTKADPQPKGKKQCLPLRDLEEQIKADVRDKIDTHKSKRVTLNDRFDLYMKTKLIKKSTKSGYFDNYDRHIRNTLGNLQIADINASMMKSFYIHFITELGFKPASVDNIHTLLNPVFTAAVEDNLIRKNPCTSAMKEIREMPAWKKKDKIKGLTCNEQHRFVDFMLSNDCFKNSVNVVTVLLGTGIRISELRGLSWENIDFDKNEINIEKQLVYRQWKDDDGVKRCYDKVIDVKTTAAERTIPIDPKVKVALLSEKERQKSLPKRDNRVDGYGNWVFLNRYGLALKADSVNSAIDRIIKKYNISEQENAYNEGRAPMYLPHQTNHMLRHTYCTRMIEKCCEPNSGLTIKLVQYLMGHEDAKTTLDIYTDVSEEFVHRTMSRFAGEIYLG